MKDLLVSIAAGLVDEPEKVKKRIANCAQPTDTVKVLLKKCDIIK